MVESHKMPDLPFVWSSPRHEVVHSRCSIEWLFNGVAQLHGRDALQDVSEAHCWQQPIIVLSDRAFRDICNSRMQYEWNLQPSQSLLGMISYQLYPYISIFSPASSFTHSSTNGKRRQSLRRWECSVNGPSHTTLCWQLIFWEYDF